MDLQHTIGNARCLATRTTAPHTTNSTLNIMEGCCDDIHTYGSILKPHESCGINGTNVMHYTNNSKCNENLELGNPKSSKTISESEHRGPPRNDYT